MDSEALISVIQENTPLWDSRDKKYHMRDIQKKLWLKVAEEMDVDVGLAKKKWQGLRDVFRKEYIKCFQGRSVDESSSEKISTWQHFQQMMFLKDVIQPRLLQTGVSPDQLEEGVVDSFIEIESVLTQPTSHSSQIAAVPAAIQPPLNRHRAKRPKKELEQDEDPFLQLQKEKLKLLAMKDDSDYQFLISLLPYLKNVHPQRKLTVRHKLQQVLLDEESYSARTACSSPTISPRSSTSFCGSPAVQD